MKPLMGHLVGGPQRIPFIVGAGLDEQLAQPLDNVNQLGVCRNGCPMKGLFNMGLHG